MLKRLRIDSLLIPIIDLLIYFACQIGIRYRNISYEIIRSDLRGFPDDYAWILWIAPFLGVFIFFYQTSTNHYLVFFQQKTFINFFRILFLLLSLALIENYFT